VSFTGRDRPEKQNTIKQNIYRQSPLKIGDFLSPFTQGGLFVCSALYFFINNKRHRLLLLSEARRRRGAGRRPARKGWVGWESVLFQTQEDINKNTWHKDGYFPILAEIVFPRQK